MVPISFGFQLPSAPTPHWISAETTPPADCPGTAAQSKAKPGHLCVYESVALNVDVRGISGLQNEADKTYRMGTIVYVWPRNTNQAFNSLGSWAVTAP